MATLLQGLGRMAPGTILQEQNIPNIGEGGFHPHKVDVFASKKPKHAIINLHGAGGTKRYQALALKTVKYSGGLIINPDDVNWTRLQYWRAAEVYPMGQACLPSNAVNNPWNPNGVDSSVPKRPTGVRTWSNRFMWSGANDPQFLLDLKQWIHNTFPTVEWVHLCGHSNGGMMVKYMWRKHPVFDRYGTTSGPTPYKLDLEESFNPSTIRPIFMQNGDMDTVLGIRDGNAGTGAHFLDSLWNQQIQQISLANVHGTMIGQTWIPQLYHTTPDWIELQRGINRYNTVHALPSETWSYGAGVVTPSKFGTLTTWTHSNGRMVLRLLSASDHKLPDQQKDAKKAFMGEFMTWVTSTL